ncbi:cation transporter [Butyrivibrio sp. NC3005]|uniref:cation transporter n=1 Tax=Butyrivibrio sp. NC3005 TaxID=1280685 RepID=UPI00041F8FDB|nr:cation transporter [Butyrivibrio sp. NC3005]
MKKKFKCEIDCAACAAKVEEAIKKVEGVADCQVNFMTQKFTLVADEEGYEDTLQRAIKAGKHVEADFEVEV